MSDKTTLKFLLFIVFLVILYLIVNRKKQIKEGFNANLKLPTNITNRIIDNLLEILTADSGVTIKATARKEEGPGSCSKNDFETQMNAAKDDMITRLTSGGIWLKGSKDVHKGRLQEYALTGTTPISQLKSMIQYISRNLYNSDYQLKIINDSEPSDSKGDRNKKIEIDDHPLLSPSRKTGNCKGYSWISSINVGGIDCENDGELVTTLTALAQAAEAAAEAAAAATALNNKKKQIKIYLDFLDNNGITLTEKNVNTIINQGVTVNDPLQQNLYTAMKDYYTRTITRHHIDKDGATIDSCESPKIGRNSLSEEECKKFREVNVGVPGAPDKEYDGYSMSTGTHINRFKDAHNYIAIYSKEQNTFGLAKGCQYRATGSTSTVRGIYYTPEVSEQATKSYIHLLCKGNTNDIEDAVQALLLRKESQTIASRFIDVLNTGGILEDIETKIVKDENLKGKFSVKAAIQNIVKELKELNIISILPAENNKNCTDFNKYSLNKEECEKYSQNNKAGTTVTADNGIELNLSKGTDPQNPYFDEIDTPHYPGGCSIRVTDRYAGIKFSTTPLTDTSNISKQYSVCKNANIAKLNTYLTELSSLSTLNGGKYKLEYEMLDALIKLLEGTGIQTSEIERHSKTIQDFIKTNTDEKLKEFEEKEHNTMMKSHGFF